jgi:hypothetical protein
MGVRLFTDKLVCWISEVPGGWSLDGATPSESAYLAHVGGSPVPAPAIKATKWTKNLFGSKIAFWQCYNNPYKCNDNPVRNGGKPKPGVNWYVAEDAI